MIFLPQGEKIKTIRKELGMNQADMQDTNLTRAFISMIELGKRRLSRESAKMIVRKFNDRAKEIGIELNINEEYLLNSPKEDAEFYCLNKLNENISENEIKDIFLIADRYNINSVKATAYEKLGDIKYKQKDYTLAAIDYSTSLDMYNGEATQNKDIIVINNKIGACKLNELLYNEAIYYFNKVYEFALKEEETLLQKKSIFNLALCYKKLEDFHKSIEYIDKFLLLEDKKEEKYIDMCILKANCYTEMKEYEKALEIFNELSNEINIDTTSLGNIYNNMGFIYLEKNMNIESLECFNKSQKIRSENSDSLLCYTLIYKSIVFKNQGLYEEAIMLTSLGIDYAEKENDYDALLKGYYQLGDIYLLLNNLEKLEEVYIKLLDLLEKVNKNIEAVKICNTLIKLYIEVGNNIKAEKYSSRSLELLEQVS